jgi:hypothetical protein
VLEGRAWTALGDVLQNGSHGAEVEGKVQGAVVRYLGPIHKLWTAGPWTHCSWLEGLSPKVTVGPPSPFSSAHGGGD